MPTDGINKFHQHFNICQLVQQLLLLGLPVLWPEEFITLASVYEKLILASLLVQLQNTTHEQSALIYSRPYSRDQDDCDFPQGCSETHETTLPRPVPLRGPLRVAAPVSRLTEGSCT